eukprot:186955-Pyramimonas_sp.AAC.1
MFGATGPPLRFASCPHGGLDGLGMLRRRQLNISILMFFLGLNHLALLLWVPGASRKFTSLC